MNSLKNLSSMILILSSFMGVLSKSWFLIWFMMEISVLMYSLLLFESEDYYSSFLYFISQTMAAILILILIFLKLKMSFIDMVFLMKEKILILCLFLKMGIFPFHKIMYKIIEYMSMKNLFFLFSLQKLIPMKILSLIKMSSIFIILISMNSIYSICFMISSSKMKIIIFSSSMNQNNMMIFLTQVNFFFTLFYLMLYSCLIFFLLKELEIMNLNFLSNFKFKNSFTLTFLIMNLSGIPFSISFWMKILFFKVMLLGGMNFLIILYFFFIYFLFSMLYIRMIFKDLMMMKNKFLKLKMSTILSIISLISMILLI